MLWLLYSAAVLPSRRHVVDWLTDALPVIFRARYVDRMAGQIVTIVGVLLGALMSYLATTMAERARFHRTIATRWDEKKLQAYIDYSACVKEIVRGTRRVFEAADAGLDYSEFMVRTEEAESRRSLLFEGLALLADERVAEAAKVVNQRTWELLALARIPVATEPGSADAARLDVVEALNAFHEVARKELQIMAIRSTESGE